MNRLLPARGFLARQIDLHLAQTHDFRRRRLFARAPQQRAHPRQKLVRAERFDQIIVRAGIEDSVMVDSLGIDVYRVFMIVFGIGAMAAGFAGIVNVPIAPITPDVGESILVETFVVVVIGGVGSFPGAVLGGLIAGEILSLPSMVDPSYSQVMLFLVMTFVLVVRLRGLLGEQGRA